MDRNVMNLVRVLLCQGQALVVAMAARNQEHHRGNEEPSLLQVVIPLQVRSRRRRARTGYINGRRAIRYSSTPITTKHATPRIW